MIDLTPIVQAIVILAAAIITTIIVPYIKSKTSINQQNQISLWIDVAVHAAEQLYIGSGRGEEKKQYVINFLKIKGFKIDIESIEALIESTVNKINNDSNTIIVN
ncbi:phage holin, LLH family [Paenibacillus pini]|uniref:Phage holin n=1 Tax=Paenibacillus pini JCM 16418 TaxID=1236976 RepID=W7YGL0_9BACL|nr:phage holin, LLH family [Paenibacillus pini]GAF07587.1 hypothetical protein JCM16418_1614 [Paenibacillus pini JCM 16418]